MSNDDKPGLGTAIVVGVGTTLTVGIAMYLVGHKHGEDYLKMLRPLPPPPDTRPVRGFPVLWTDRSGSQAGSVRIRYPKDKLSAVMSTLKQYPPDKYAFEDVRDKLRAINAEFSPHRDNTPGYEGVYSSCGVVGGSKNVSKHASEWSCKKAKSFVTTDGDRQRVAVGGGREVIRVRIARGDVEGAMFDVWFYEDIHAAVDKILGDAAANTGSKLNRAAVKELVKLGAEVVPA